VEPEFLQFAEQCPDAVMVTDAAGTIEYVNSAFERITGYSSAEIVGRTPAVLKSGTHEADFYRELWAALLGGGEFRAVFANRRKGGELYYEEKIIRPLAGGRFASFGRDTTERAREFEKLSHAATHDSLTDLPNRGLFLDRLAQALLLATRRSEPLTVAIFDIDQFKDANTRHGHLGGDAVLQAVAARTRGCIREADTVARIGGDEFALILSGAGETQAAPVLQKIVKANALPVPFGEDRIQASVSVGACVGPRGDAGAEELRRRADAAMYAAKTAGGNRYGFSR
jgi:diguanylate cyclase (GGDEF)-like protein/PAS domain S-box-containing protein